MFDEAVSIVQNDPTKLPEGETEVTQENYFRIVSLSRLGTEQAVQFQSGDQYGADWHWGSKCSAAGVCDTNAEVANNALAEMPRSYDNNTNGADAFGNYYGWYAATAESGTFEMASVNAPDSLCPAGWQLPHHDAGKSWYNLLVTKYKLNTNAGDGSDGTETIASSENKIRTLPLSLVRSSNYDWTTGDPGSRNSIGRFWSSLSSNNVLSASLVFRNGVISMSSSNRPNGFTVRCIHK